jgi:hypothetical protein
LCTGYVQHYCFPVSITAVCGAANSVSLRGACDDPNSSQFNTSCKSNDRRRSRVCLLPGSTGPVGAVYVPVRSLHVRGASRMVTVAAVHSGRLRSVPSEPVGNSAHLSSRRVVGGLCARPHCRRPPSCRRVRTLQDLSRLAAGCCLRGAPSPNEFGPSLGASQSPARPPQHSGDPTRVRGLQRDLRARCLGWSALRRVSFSPLLAGFCCFIV